MKKCFSAPPPNISEIDFAAVIDAVREHGEREGRSIKKLRWRLEMSGVQVVTDNRAGRGTRLKGETWEVRGVYLQPSGVFRCTSFKGNPDACHREFTVLRVSL